MNETQDVTLPTLVAVSQLPGAVFYRQNCGTFLTMDGKRVIQATSIDGLGDLMGGFRGWATAIETKTRRGRMQKTQKIFRTNWEAAGNVYIVARCPDDAVSALLALPVRLA